MLGCLRRVDEVDSAASFLRDGEGRSRHGGGEACCERRSAQIAVRPSAHPICGALGEAAVACQAVLHMDRQFGIPAAHWADRNVLAHTTPQDSVEFTVDERVDVTPIAEMIEVHHAGGNPTSLRMLPAE